MTVMGFVPESRSGILQRIAILEAPSQEQTRGFNFRVVLVAKGPDKFPDVAEHII